jgi:hypothetical protein
MSRRVRELNDKLVLKVASAELGNRLARASFLLSAVAEYSPAADNEDAKP